MVASVLSPALRNKLSMPPTVVIIGGSHSAWSVASLLLEGSRRGMQPEAKTRDKVSDMLRAFSRGCAESGPGDRNAGGGVSAGEAESGYTSGGGGGILFLSLIVVVWFA